MGGAVRNYEKPDKSWGKINNNWKLDGDSVYIDEAVLKVSLDTLTGSSSVSVKWDGQSYIITQSLMGIGWLKMSTKGRQWIDNTMNWGDFSADSNIAKWTGISPAVDYRVRKLDGTIQSGIFFKKAFLDSAVALYNQRTDSLDIALANVMVYTLSSNIDNHNLELGDIPERRLKSFGRYALDIGRGRLHYPNSDTLPTIPVGQFWRKRNDSIFCIEYVMMSQVKRIHSEYPNATIWHNAETKIEGDTDIEDASLHSSGNAEKAFGGRATEMRVDDNSNIHGIIRVLNVATRIGAGATITDAICSLHVFDERPGGAGGDIQAYRVLKAWTEGDQDFEDCVAPGISYNDWSCTASEWRTAGCECADDDGVDNSSGDVGTCEADGSNADRLATAESTVSIIDEDDDEWYGWDISNALAQGWYDGSFNENGILLHGDDGDGTTTDVLFEPVEHTTAANRPFFVFTYTVAAAGQKIMIRK